MHLAQYCYYAKYSDNNLNIHMLNHHSCNCSTHNYNCFLLTPNNNYPQQILLSTTLQRDIYFVHYLINQSLITQLAAPSKWCEKAKKNTHAWISSLDQILIWRVLLSGTTTASCTLDIRSCLDPVRLGLSAAAWVRCTTGCCATRVAWFLRNWTAGLGSC